MIAPQTLARTQSCKARIDLGKSSAPDKSTVAGNLCAVSSANSPPCPISSGDGGVRSRIFQFEPNSANGQPLGDVNKSMHMENLFNRLQKKENKIDNLDKFTQVMNQGNDRDLENSTLKYGTKAALALFNALPADKQDNALMNKALSFYNAMAKLSPDPASSANQSSAYKALKAFTSELYNKMGLSEKTGQAANLEKFCSNYLESSVYPDIIAKLSTVLSSGHLEELKSHPEKVVEHLYVNENKANNNIINELKKEFFEHKNTSDKTVKMFSLIEALEQKTQIIARLATNSVAQETSPPAGLDAANDIGQPRPAGGIHAGPVAPNVTNITNNYNITYNVSSPTSNNLTANINLSSTATTTKSADNNSPGAAVNKAPADIAHFSTKSVDEVDSQPAPSPADNLKHATAANTQAGKSLNSAGTLYGTKGPAPSWLGQDAKVTLTNDGQVRDLSQKQAYGQDGAQQKQPSSLNTFGNQFVGFGQQKPAPAPLRGADKAPQDGPPADNSQSPSTAKDIPVADNALNSEKISRNNDDTKPEPSAKLVAGKSLNAQGTLLGTDGSVPSKAGTSADVITTSGGQVFDLAGKQRYAKDNVVEKQPNVVNKLGTAFQGMRPQSSAPAALRGAANTEQVRQDAPQVSYKADLLVPGKKPNFITTLDIQVNSDGTLQSTADLDHVIPAKVVAEKHVNAQGTSFGMNVGAVSASTQSGLANHDSVVTLTQQGAQTRELSRKLAYQLGGTQPKSASSVNAQGNQFVGVGKSPSIPELTQSWINNKGANVVLTQEGAQTRSLTEKDQYRADKFTPRSQSNNQSTNPPEAE